MHALTVMCIPDKLKSLADMHRLHIWTVRKFRICYMTIYMKKGQIKGKIIVV
jgi:hypothetical protein